MTQELKAKTDPLNSAQFKQFDALFSIFREYFELIPREYLAAGKGKSGKVGQAQSRLFDATDFVKFAVQWLENRYSTQQ